MKKIAFILVALMACSSAFAQESPKPHDTVWQGATRYLITSVNEHTYTMVEFTPEDTINWKNQQTVTYNSPWFRFDQGIYNHNKGIGIGCPIGLDYSPSLMAGMSIYIDGAYMDVLFGGYKIDHGVTRKVYQPGDYDDGKSLAVHIGFFLPVYTSTTSSIKVAPLIGIWTREYGITHIYRYNWGWCQGDYMKTGEKYAFDYGVNVKYSYGRSGFVTFDLSLQITRHTCTFGIGTTFSL